MLLFLYLCSIEHCSHNRLPPICASVPIAHLHPLHSMLGDLRFGNLVLLNVAEQELEQNLRVEIPLNSPLHCKHIIIVLMT